jgi:hypothetical protein
MHQVTLEVIVNFLNWILHATCAVVGIAVEGVWYVLAFWGRRFSMTVSLGQRSLKIGDITGCDQEEDTACACLMQWVPLLNVNHAHLFRGYLVLGTISF